MKGDTRAFTRRLILHERFFDQSYTNNSLVKKPSGKFISTHNNELKEIVNHLHKIDPAPIAAKSNLTRDEEVGYTQLKSLSKSTLEIKKADKSDTWVIMDKSEYRKLILKEHLQTNTYEKAATDANKNVHRHLVKLTNKYDGCITKDEKKFLSDDRWEDANFYGLPKLHKCKEVIEKIRNHKGEYLKMKMPPSLKTRPICGGPQAVTQGASKLLHEILSPLLPEMRSYVKDEWDFVRNLPRKVSFNATLLSCDIVSLYSSIPTELGLEALDYWIDRCRDKIPSRFTKEFILEMTKFVLENNFCMFDSEMYHQVTGTAMGAIFAPPYACLVIGYLEETKLFKVLLPAHFDPETCQRIIDFFYRFMDDGTTLFPTNVDKDLFLRLLNSMHPAIKYTVAQPERLMEHGKQIQRLVFLSLLLHLDSDGNIWTDVFYKQTNTHEYLHFESHHPSHVKANIPYVLAKRIVVFTTKEESMEKNLQDLRRWLLNCGYPEKVINDGIHNAKLQGPAPPKDRAKVIPLISTYYKNYNNASVIQVAKSMLRQTKDERLINAFHDVKFIHAYRQPPNLLRSFTHSKFEQKKKNEVEIVGVFKCGSDKCKICVSYLQLGTQVRMSNGFMWEVKCFGDCNSLNVLYFQICNVCNVASKIGKTDNFRDRTNNHISGCRWGNTSDKFDNHVFECWKGKNMGPPETFFKIWILMVCSNYHKLLSHESALHSQGLDTINNPLS